MSHGSSLEQIPLSIMFKITECFDPSKHLDHSENSFSFSEGGGSRRFVSRMEATVRSMYSSVIQAVWVNTGTHTCNY